MSILKVVQYPDAVLKKISAPVTQLDGAFQSFLDDLLETMYAEDGMGIAAIQVGVLQRVFIMDENPHEGRNPIIFINPEIIFQSEEKVDDVEGCLSFRGVTPITIKRAQTVSIKALDRTGKEFTCERDNYSAKCMQHEFDHLEGITFFDHLTMLKRQLAEKKLQKYKRTSM